MKSRDLSEAIKDICEANGLDHGKLEQQASSVTSIEMMLYNFPKIQGLESFANLTELNIMQQSITDIEGLGALENLTKLWICETNISRIQGLEPCHKLEHLFLYSNRIKVMENLNFPQLQCLWLADNSISTIEGLEGLPRLESLSLASNRIRKLGRGLGPVQSTLTSLSLAGNMIGSFKDLLNLKPLTSLLSLEFNDATYGDNPVCDLCNYQTYCLFRFQSLTSLDNLVIAEDAKQLSEATYMKKRMYYNMRIKTLKRNSNNLVRRAREAQRMRQDYVSNLNRRISRDLKTIELEVQGLQEGSISGDSRDYDCRDLQSKTDELKQLSSDSQLELDYLSESFEDFKERVHDMAENATAKLIVELETGGNIRLEDGRAKDVWFQSCADLVRSRFVASDFSKYGIKDVQVTRVVRVHNRYLRNQFEERLESMVDITDPSYKRSLEYLFFAEDPSMEGEALRAAEKGFRESYGAFGLADSVQLTNSVSVAEMPRLIQDLRRQGKAVTPEGFPMSTVGLRYRSGQLLICKTFLARSGPLGGKDAVINKQSFPKLDSVFEPAGADGRQRRWYILDNTLVLPEYIVEIDYTMSGSISEPSQAFAESLIKTGFLPRQKEAEAADVGPLMRGLLRFMYQARIGELISNEIDPDIERVLNSPPALHPRPKVKDLSPTNIVEALPDCSPATATHAVMHDMGIISLNGIDIMLNLKSLTACFNSITDLTPLIALPHLEQLDVSYNHLSRVDVLSKCPVLSHVDASFNHVARSEELAAARRCLTSMQHLSLKGNPVAELKSYRTYMLRKLVKLKTLDGTLVTEEERRNASDSSSSITTEMICELGRTRRKTDWSLVPQRLRGDDNVAMMDSDDEGDVDEDGAIIDTRQSLAASSPSKSAGTLRNIVELDADSKKIRRMGNLEQVPNLRVLSLNDNEIGCIAGVDHLCHLQELLLENNRLSSLDGIQTLTQLRRLDVGKNRLQDISALSCLQSLQQFAVEDNELSSLEPIERLPVLLELYAGNNVINDIREVLRLRETPKLIILDLSGNHLTASAEYRLFTVYHLKRLKVLDGAGVDTAEQSLAHDTYAGRLTDEFLTERIGHNFYKHIRELDLSSSKLRDIADVLCSPDLCNMRVLSLEHNQISDLNGLSALVNLSVLRAAFNKVDLSQGKNEIRGIGSMSSLEVLDLSHNDTQSMLGLRAANLCDLKILNLGHNNIAKVEGIEHLSQLRELVLDKNKVRYLDANSLIGLHNLRELHINENGLRSLTNVGPLPRLIALHVVGNRVTDLQDIDKLSQLPHLTEVSMQGNPVARKQVYRPTVIHRIHTLRILDGREIVIDERERVALMFTQEAYRSPAVSTMAGGANANAGGLVSKVAMRVPAVTFDQLTGVGMPASQQAAAAPSFLSIAGFGKPEQSSSAIDWAAQALQAHKQQGHAHVPTAGRRAASGGGGSGGGQLHTHLHAMEDVYETIDMRSQPAGRRRAPGPSSRPRSGDKGYQVEQQGSRPPRGSAVRKGTSVSVVGATPRNQTFMR